jgi:hypothetical protein
MLAWGAGLVLAAAQDFQGVYLRTIPLYLTLFGLLWSAAAFRWGTRKLLDIMQEIRPCFVVDDAEFERFVRRWFQRMTDHRAIAALSAVLLIFYCSIVYLSLLQPGLVQMLGLGSLRPGLYPPEWFEGDLVARLGILYLFGLVSAVPFGAALWALMVNVLMLNALRKLPIVYFPPAILVNFRGFSNFYFMTALCCFVASGVMVFVVISHLDAFSLFVVFGLGSIGFATFFWPQYVVHGYLCDAYGHMVNRILGPVKRLNEGSDWSQLSPAEQSTRADEFANLVTITQPARLWVYEPKDVMILLLGQLLPLVGLVAQSLDVFR